MKTNPSSSNRCTRCGRLLRAVFQLGTTCHNTEACKRRAAAKLVRKDCGIHFGHSSGPCAKCAHFGALMARPEIRAGLQFGGTPFSAVIGEPQGVSHAV